MKYCFCEASIHTTVPVKSGAKLDKTIHENQFKYNIILSSFIYIICIIFYIYYGIFCYQQIAIFHRFWYQKPENVKHRAERCKTLHIFYTAGCNFQKIKCTTNSPPPVSFSVPVVKLMPLVVSLKTEFEKKLVIYMYKPHILPVPEVTGYQINNNI